MSKTMTSGWFWHKTDFILVLKSFLFLHEAGENLRILSLQQTPVGGDLHFQVLLDAKELLVVSLGALHVQPELGEVILELIQGGLQPLHLRGVFLTSLTQVTFQCWYLRREGGEY